MIDHDELFLELGFPALSEHMGASVTYHYVDGGSATATAVIGEEEGENRQGQYHETVEQVLHCVFQRADLRELLQQGDYLDYDRRRWSFVKVVDRTSTVLTIQFKASDIRQTGMRTKGL
ncbi:hypothetical protein Pla110_44360 [Polystyrenella longa]|uniref:Uncharacterized protein n=1 Tax=Polystyrenella longa TaxID=2528007 RepID=A0A518CTY7_9PLAN|nr:hypothetical protein [Polystyrenella longa]QDU82675.1 hypothetical protein Pla110_44360 [Polystyrenella longa]